MAGGGRGGAPGTQPLAPVLTAPHSTTTYSLSVSISQFHSSLLLDSFLYQADQHSDISFAKYQGFMS